MDHDDQNSEPCESESQRQTRIIESGRRLDCSDGSVIVKGVRLPATLVRQLEALGSPLEVYSVGQLQDALMAIEADGVLVDDEEGVTFEDMLHLTDDERREREQRRQAYRLRSATFYTHLFSDLRDPTPEQVINPWCAPNLAQASECDVADGFEMVHFGHEQLFENIQSPVFAESPSIRYDWGVDKDGYPILNRFFE